MNLLAIPGSLRAASINRSLLRAAARLAPPGVTVVVYEGLGGLPLFNPDLEADPPASVRALRQAVAQADALLIASPEYAHGISGAMKNALDWLVSFEPFISKHVAVLNASPRARHADGSLKEILHTMSAIIVEAASISLPLLGAALDEDAMVANHAIADAVQTALSALCQSVDTSPSTFKERS